MVKKGPVVKMMILWLKKEKASRTALGLFWCLSFCLFLLCVFFLFSFSFSSYFPFFSSFSIFFFSFPFLVFYKIETGKV